MSQLDKIKDKLLNSKAAFTYQELESLLGKIGYVEIKTGKTAGSRRAFYKKETDHLIRIHKPHPGNELKNYIKKYIIFELKKNDEI